ncbi:MAG: 23S rRNA (uracil(1939)-C(5))-methyltransferase RlmD [Clostridia bacterium]|nr:23S rRNA (uracil(1939)-C(5))-methyltransferase RlmD [Clostridia bacterium]
MIKKNEKHTVDIIDQGIEGQGIAKIDGFTIFINGAIKGEKVNIVITKVLSSYAYGKILEIKEKSEFRRESDCVTYKRCGGCSLRHIDYKKTLEIKTEMVKNCLKKALNYIPIVNDCIGMESPLYYRNKLQYPIGVDNLGNPVMGVYANRTHEIIETKECLIQDEESQQIANCFFKLMVELNIKPYNESSRTGDIRHLIIRKGKKTNEVMVTIVTNTENVKEIETLVDKLTNEYESIKTIAQNINSKNTNVILGDKTKILYGSGYIEDYLGDYKFKISPVSFYQVNPIQTEVLYSKAVEYAELTGIETIFDLYCGIGTIGIFASDKAKKICGIEVIPEAIENAKENAKLNNVKNSEFLVGEVEELLPDLVKKEEADVVFIDPPRKGCEKTVLETLLEVKPKKIVYISCNPATLARDLSILCNKYEIKEVQPVDMFPYTSHCESVCVLERK